MLFPLGIALLILAAIAFAFNLRTSYVTHGGGIGQVPVLASTVIQVPLLEAISKTLVRH